MKKYDVVALGELLIDFTDNGRSSQGNPVFEANSLVSWSCDLPLAIPLSTYLMTASSDICACTGAAKAMSANNKISANAFLSLIRFILFLMFCLRCCMCICILQK